MTHRAGTPRLCGDASKGNAASRRVGSGLVLHIGWKAATRSNGAGAPRLRGDATREHIDGVGSDGGLPADGFGTRTLSRAGAPMTLAGVARITLATATIAAGFVTLFQGRRF